eukprot:scaffold1784_cov116-Cylindrotheca_fusiformis.AAC.17
MSKIPVEFGETKADLRIRRTGVVRHSVKLSPSFALFALDIETEIDYGQYFNNATARQDQPEKTRILDVMLTRRDGWSNAVIDELMSQMQGYKGKIIISGFPERRTEKTTKESNVFCLHAVSIDFHDDSIVFTRVPTPEPLQQTNEKEKTVSKKSKNSDRGANDASRFAKLVFFLLSEFGGYEALRELPIVDVAGGSGGLAFELTVRHQLPCIIVDTRPMQYTGAQKRHLEFRKHSLEQLNSISESKSTRLLHNLKSRFEAGVTDNGLLRQFHTLLDTESVLNRSSIDSLQHEDKEQKAILNDILHQRDCSVLVGLHPDQATDPIIDIGFALNIPWVVVPCCVFPNFFTQRRLQPSGRMVRTYEDLCQYILQRDPNVKEISLPFRGRNRVFYWHPRVVNESGEEG